MQVRDLLHQVNNLLGTIEIQAEVARTVDTLEAAQAALRHIVESARRTDEQVRRLRAELERASDG